MKNKKLIFTFLLTSILFACAPKETLPLQLVVNHLPNKSNYDVGEYFVSDGITIIDLYGNKVTDYTLSVEDGTTFNEIGNKQITVYKEGYISTSFTVKVNAYHSLYIQSYPSKTTYLENDSFSLAGLELVDEFNNLIDLKTCSFSYYEGYKVPPVGEYVNTINKSGYKSVSYPFTVELLNNEIFINKLPDKLNYNQGDLFDPTGLKIIDKKGNEVFDYTISPSINSKLVNTGEITVTVSKEGCNDISFTINVDSSVKPMNQKSLRFFLMNDTHGTFSYSDTYKEPGMAILSTYLKEERAKAPNNTVLLSAGDMFQGGYESNETNGEIMIDAMKEMGFDAMALGNHEFDWGEDVLKEIAKNLKKANIPLLSCNTFYSSLKSVTNKKIDYLNDYTIIEKDGIKIGVIGSILNGIESSIDNSVSQYFSFPDPVNYIKTYSDTLRLTYSCDLVVLLSHDPGYETDEESEPSKFYSLTEISPKTNSKYVDAMFFGHDHQRKSGVMNDVPFLEAGENGKALGEITINLNGNSDGYKITSTTSTNYLTYTMLKKTTPDPEIEEMVSTKYSKIMEEASKVLYTFTNSYSKVEFTKIISQAMVWFVNKYSEEYFDCKYVYLGCHNTAGTRAAVYKSDFKTRDLIKVCPFDNPLCITNSNQVQYNYMVNSSYYRTYKNGDPVYDKSGCTQCVTISYISDSRYGRYVQENYEQYDDYSAKMALYEFLTSGEFEE